MSRGPYRFRQREVTRAIKAARAAGVEIGAVKVDRDGAIVILPRSPSCKAPGPDEGTNEWAGIQ